MSADTFDEIKVRLQSVIDDMCGIRYDLFSNNFTQDQKEELLELTDEIMHESYNLNGAI